MLRSLDRVDRFFSPAIHYTFLALLIARLEERRDELRWASPELVIHIHSLLHANRFLQHLTPSTHSAQISPHRIPLAHPTRIGTSRFSSQSFVLSLFRISPFENLLVEGVDEGI